MPGSLRIGSIMGHLILFLLDGGKPTPRLWVSPVKSSLSKDRQASRSVFTPLETHEALAG
jgi:hypothetical protein